MDKDDDLDDVVGFEENVKDAGRDELGTLDETRLAVVGLDLNGDEGLPIMVKWSRVYMSRSPAEKC